MQFSSKLSLMLNIFEVKNLDLADKIKTDRTLISRWRSGQRKPAYNSPQIVMLGKYFAELLCVEKNANLFKSAFGLDELVFPSNDELCGLLTNWLCDDSKNVNHLISGLSIHDKRQIFTTDNTILYFEGFEGFANASNCLKTFLNDCDKPKKIRISMDYRMHTYLTNLKDQTHFEDTLLNYAANLGHQLELITNVDNSSMPYYVESFSQYFAKDTVNNFSLYIYSTINPCPNYFIIVEDEVIEYGTFSDNLDFAPIISHVSTHENIIKVFRSSYDNLLRYSHKINLKRYV